MSRTGSTPFEATGPKNTVPGLQEYKPRHTIHTMDDPRLSSNPVHDDTGFNEADFSLYSHLPQTNIPQHQLAVADWIDSSGVGDYDPTTFLTDEALSCNGTQGTQHLEPTLPLPADIPLAPSLPRRLSSEASTYGYGDYSQPMSSNTEHSPLQQGVPILSQQSSMSYSDPFESNGFQISDTANGQLDPFYTTSPLEHYADNQPDDIWVNQLAFAAGQQDDLFCGSSTGESSYPSPPQDNASLWDSGPYQPQPCRTVSLPMHPVKPARQQMVSPPLSEPNGNFSLVSSSASHVSPLEGQYQSLGPSYPTYGHPVTFTEPVLSATTPQNFARSDSTMCIPSLRKANLSIALLLKRHAQYTGPFSLPLKGSQVLLTMIRT